MKYLPYKFKDMIGKHVLIIGDHATGKTVLTTRLIEESIQMNLSSKITVLELAPRIFLKNEYIGLEIADYTDMISKVTYLKTKNINAPRIQGKNHEESLYYANHNRKKFEKLLHTFMINPTDTLFINDLTMFFHTGKPDMLFNIIQKTKTVICNGYEGIFLPLKNTSIISKKEIESLNKLKKYMDVIIHLK